ncbi:tubby C-terminal-like domain-containing protein [Obelidium mucronatum]|nr:tubby C-terminal-like domain-containing protein [Obelidium mucronatum]
MGLQQQLQQNPVAAISGVLGGILGGGGLAGALGGKPQAQQQGFFPQQQHPQQQQYHPQQPLQQGPNAYITQQQITLTLKESYGSFSGDDMTISDQSGRHWFRLDAQTFSMRDKRTLLDANTGVPVVRLEKKFGLGKKWQASGPSGNVLFTIESQMFSFTPQISVYLNDGDRNPDYKVTGSFMAKDFQLFDIRNGGNTVVGNCKKERPFNLNAFISTVLMNKDSYFLTLNPGADVSLWVSVCVLLDELFHEENSY